MSRPRLLDLFCGAGGAGMGYHRAGFDVVGVDIAPQPHYPFEFHQADAMTYPLDGFDAIHASPPCQAYSAANNAHGRDDHPDLVAATRVRLATSGRPWVIENVPGAPLTNFVVLCGSMFGLGVKRHRRFETSFMVWAPPLCVSNHPGDWVTIFGGSARERRPKGQSRGYRPSVPFSRAKASMGIDWMTRDELSQAIPPAYTEWIGAHLLAAVKAAA